MSFGIPVRNGLGVGLLASTSLSTRGGAGGFSPASLFASGEPGGWYDIDPAYMFQDSAGTSPVTATGQTVGLVLDRSKGLVLGPELVTNGTFDSGVTSWTGVNATLSGSSGTCVITADGLGQARASQTVTTVAGRWYEARATLARGTGAVNVDLLIPGIANSAAVATNTPTEVVLRFAATGAITTVRAGSNGSAVAGTTYIVDNISVKELPGNHLSQPTLANRPIYGIEPFGGRRNLLTYTEQFDNAVWGKAASATVTANTSLAPDNTLTADTANFPVNLSRVEQTISGLNTGPYIFSLYLKGINGETVNVELGSSVLAVALNGQWQRVYVTNSGSTSYTAMVIKRSSNTASSVFIWGAQLETGSTATAYQRVTDQWNVTQAGVPSVGYLQYDGSDDWFVSPTITPGIDKVQVFAGVRKLSDAARGMLVELGGSAVTSNFLNLSAPGSALANYSIGAGGSSFVGPAPTGNVHPAPITNTLTFTDDIAADNGSLRVNGGAAQQLLAGDQGTGNFAANPLYVGRRSGTSLPYNGRIYSLIVRFGANLTADQIAQTENYVNSKTGAY